MQKNKYPIGIVKTNHVKSQLKSVIPII